MEGEQTTKACASMSVDGAWTETQMADMYNYTRTAAMKMQKGECERTTQMFAPFPSVDGVCMKTQAATEPRGLVVIGKRKSIVAMNIPCYIRSCVLVVIVYCFNGVLCYMCLFTKLSWRTN